MRRDASSLTGLSPARLDAIVALLERGLRRRGRPWSLSLRRRLDVVCTSLRTNLTLRELAALFAISTSAVHRILVDLVPRIAALLEVPATNDRRRVWIVDGTLIPTRDHRVAARSKNYRYSCNIQLLARHHDRRVIAVAGGGPGNRNDVIHYRGSAVESLCREHPRVLADGGYRGIPELSTPRFAHNRIVRDRRWRRHCRRRARVEHVFARMKDWRALRDYRRRAATLVSAVRAVAFFYNLKLQNVS